MKKNIVWLTVVVAAFGWSAMAEVVITSPTGLPDESDVVLESVVDTIKEIPADAVNMVVDVIDYTGDELRNTAHGVTSVFKGNTPREAIRKEMLAEVGGAWDASDDTLLRSYKITSAVIGEMAPGEHAAGAVLDVSSFFNGIDFPENTGAYLWPDSSRLMVRNTRKNLLQVEAALSQYHRAERDYKQVEINAKFIEVSQSTLNQLGFTWRIEDAAGDGVRLSDNLSLLDNQDILSAGLRTAAGAFGAGASGGGSMVLTKTGWMPLRVAITALEQASDSDVLSSPSLTTKDGTKAEIWVGEDRMVPSRFNANSTEVNVHVEHTDWDSELMGVYFSVTPEIREENLIHLELNPKIVDLVGYDTYEVAPAASMLMIHGSAPSSVSQIGTYPILNLPAQGISKAWEMMAATLGPLYDNPNEETDPNDMHGPVLGGADEREWTYINPNYGYNDGRRMLLHEEFGTKLPSITGSLPYFRVREIKTQVNVADGSTVGLGGLIYDRLETYKDKVPVLGSIPLIGRLFRSEGEKSIKRNLMIFVSATQVGDDGQRKSDIALNN